MPEFKPYVIEGGAEPPEETPKSLLGVLDDGQIAVTSLNIQLDNLGTALGTYREGNLDVETVGDYMDKVERTADRHDIKDITGLTTRQLLLGNVLVHPAVANSIIDKREARSERLGNFITRAMKRRKHQGDHEEN